MKLQFTHKPEACIHFSIQKKCTELEKMHSTVYRGPQFLHCFILFRSNRIKLLWEKDSKINSTVQFKTNYFYRNINKKKFPFEIK